MRLSPKVCLAAFHEMQPLYPEYCPPLIPQQVLQFLVMPGARKDIAGKFPTTSGQYRRLVIRQACLPEVDPQDLRVKRLTDKRYYEVCTDPELYRLTG
ncbi:MAG: hypothetical protein U1D67_01545 [Dehalococcoidia bacterium]|nr:hypothetical protein [Desulfobacterales bacterium]MDZ4245782.1 hypothetical protein [Dehalococcoidia bacterium]